MGLTCENYQEQEEEMSEGYNKESTIYVRTNIINRVRDVFEINGSAFIASYLYRALQRKSNKQQVTESILKDISNTASAKGLKVVRVLLFYV